MRETETETSKIERGRQRQRHTQRDRLRDRDGDTQRERDPPTCKAVILSVSALASTELLQDAQLPELIRPIIIPEPHTLSITSCCHDLYYMRAIHTRQAYDRYKVILTRDGDCLSNGSRVPELHDIQNQENSVQLRGVSLCFLCVL